MCALEILPHVLTYCHRTLCVFPTYLPASIIFLGYLTHFTGTMFQRQTCASRIQLQDKPYNPYGGRQHHTEKFKV
ncbi:hypothetical protein SERLADRAFT_377982, partial [Serpula lacrymans var. lacrymans S7.9]